MPRNVIGKHVAILALVLAILPVTFAETVKDRLHEYLEAVESVDHFNGSVLVAKGDAILISQGVGLANAEHSIANSPTTKFRIGSITKQFTAMAIMVLAEQGKLSVEDPISKHLPNAADSWSDVTVHHLLTHTSGIPSYTGMSNYGRDMMLPQTLKQMIARFRDEPLEFTPGKEFHYSNSGYFLLGAIIENISATTYAEFLSDEIFEPLGMKDSGYDRFETVLKNRASGYDRTPDGLVHSTYLDMTQPYAAGSLYSTVEDLNLWDTALRSRKLISPERYNRMYTPALADYAYGWSVTKKDQRTAISHGGGINGFTSFILRFPDEKVCVVVLSNVQPSSPTKIARDLAAIVMGKEYEVPRELKAVAVDPNVFSDYVGTYELQPGLTLTISREGDALMAEVTGEPKIQLSAESKTTFFEKSVGAVLTFHHDEDGKTEVVVNHGGHKARALRTVTGTVDKPQPAIAP